MKLDQTQLVAGDQVGVRHCGTWQDTYQVKTVKSVSKTGQVVLESGERFTADGRLMGSQSRTYLVPAIEAEDAIKSKIEGRERLARIAAAEAEFASLIRNHKNGMGHVSPISTEDKQKLIDLINAM